ncbi:DUF3006 domain-containing protein [Solibacillus sp. A46]|uniref:DUF3006 domain-containing protein n=1 Tax=Solibacillus faecavium TaxID=2762221 RepID=A0ABR8XXE1_9BACL|nr:DUF3006 domain-containing protein [Solibacillus faecavium]MBD8036489.1 DUF3006 domain-containing protein [Solibacillus faecavium]
MNDNKYTLDRFEGDYAIFLKRTQETDQLLIQRDEISVEVKEGDIVEIQDDGFAYTIRLLPEETANQKQRVNNLLEQLRNKNK